MPESYIAQALKSLTATLSSKNSDYKIDGEFSNFEYAAAFIGDADVPSIILAQMGIKLGRLKGLPVDPNNESRLDTFQDLAGYAVILYAHALSEAKGEPEVEDHDDVEWGDDEDDDYPDAGASTCSCP